MIKDLAPTLREQVRRLLPAPDPGPDDDAPEGAASAAPTTTLLVVRHGHAGDREKWDGPDERRPLSKKGRRHAVGLVELLEGFGIGRIVSSRYMRCLESVVPLACERGLGIDIHPALAEGSSVAELGAFVAELRGTTTVLCTHGDVIWNLLVDLAHYPVAAGQEGGGDLPMAKGSTWVVEGQVVAGQVVAEQVVAGQDDRPAAIRYLPPPRRS